MLRETASKEVSLEVAAEDRQWGADVTCCDRLFQTREPATGMLDIANGGPTSARGWWVTATKESADVVGLRDPPAAQFNGEVWRNCLMQTFCTRWLEINPLFRLQPMQLTEERGDVVKRRRWKHQPRTAVPVATLCTLWPCDLDL